MIREQCRHCGRRARLAASDFPFTCLCGAVYGTADDMRAGTVRARAVQADPPPAEGPGTELKKLLASIGITASKDCSCKAMAAKMNRWGCDGCRENRAVIVRHLEKAAAKRGWAAKILARGFVLGALVDRAISQAESREPDCGAPA